MMIKNTIYWALISCLFANAALAQEDVPTGTPITKSAEISSTKHDFTETLIKGKMKAPTGFFITGKKSQTMTQMVKLRSNFRQELTSSFDGAKILTH